MPQRILIIDDDQRLCAMLEQYLSQGGYEVVSRHTADDGLAEQRRASPDAIILDLMLPDANGLDVCTRLRESTGVPIIMLTARGEATDRVVGLELGADDYLPKPFDPRELLARLRTVLRRGTAAVNPTLRFGRLENRSPARQVRLDGQCRNLTPATSSTSCSRWPNARAGWSAATSCSMPSPAARWMRSTAPSMSTSPTSAPRSRINL